MIGGAQIITYWTTAVEQAADVLGEMLMEMASGEEEHTHDEIAAATLVSGLKSLLGDGPGSERVETAARVAYEYLHAPEKTWEQTVEIEREFWLDLARASLKAADASLLRALEVA